MSDLEELCVALDVVGSRILQMAQELNSKAILYNKAAANAAAAGRSAGSEATPALTRTASALSNAAVCCGRAAQLLISSGNEARAFVTRTVGSSKTASDAGVPGSLGAEDAADAADADELHQVPGTAETEDSWWHSVARTAKAVLTTIEIAAVTATSTAAVIDASNLPVSMPPEGKAAVRLLSDANDGIEAGADAYREGEQISEDIDDFAEVTTSELIDPPSWVSNPTRLEASINDDLAEKNRREELPDGGGPSGLLS